MDPEQFETLIDILGKIRFEGLVLMLLVSSIWTMMMFNMWKK